VVVTREVRVEVTDDVCASSKPHLREPDTTRVRGRGLRIVDAVSGEFGAERVRPGHMVWFVLAVEG
jgi:anti-sigma regulatory factor (Ser/Thr protein kinase)